MSRFLFLPVIIACVFIQSLSMAQDNSKDSPIAVGVFADKAKTKQVIERTAELFLKDQAFLAIDLSEPATTMLDEARKPFFSVFEIEGRRFEYVICLPLKTTSEHFYKQFGEWGDFHKDDNGHLKYTVQGIDTFVDGVGDYVVFGSSRDAIRMVPNDNPEALIPERLNQEGSLFQLVFLPRNFSKQTRDAVVSNPNWANLFPAPGSPFELDDFEAIHLQLDLTDGRIDTTVKIMGAPDSPIAQAARSDLSASVPAIARYANKRSAVKGWFHSRAAIPIVAAIDQFNGPQGRELFIDLFNQIRNNGKFAFAFNFRESETPSFLLAMEIADGKEYSHALPETYFTELEFDSPEWQVFQLNVIKEMGIDSQLFLSDREIVVASSDSVTNYSSRLPKAKQGVIGQLKIRCENLIDIVNNMGHFETFPEFYQFSKLALSNFPGHDKIRFQISAHDSGYQFSLRLERGVTFALLDVPSSIGRMEEATFEKIASELDKPAADVTE